MKITRIVFLLITSLLMACSSQQPVRNLNYGKITFEGGNGKKISKAIVIKNAESMAQGMKAIKYYLKETFGQQGPDWVLFSKGQVEEAGKEYYLYEIALKGKKKTKVIFFDVSDFWGTY